MATIPMIKLPSGVRSSLPGNWVAGRPMKTAGSGAGVLMAGGVTTGVTCPVCVCVRSKINSVLFALLAPDPWVVTSTRPSMPTATPSGRAGRLTVTTTESVAKSITLRVELWVFVT